VILGYANKLNWLELADFRYTRGGGSGFVGKIRCQETRWRSLFFVIHEPVALDGFGLTLGDIGSPRDGELRVIGSAAFEDQLGLSSQIKITRWISAPVKRFLATRQWCNWRPVSVDWDPTLYKPPIWSHRAGFRHQTSTGEEERRRDILRDEYTHSSFSFIWNCSWQKMNKYILYA